MARVLVIIDGEQQLFEAEAWAEMADRYPAPDAVIEDVPEGFPDYLRWDGSAFVPRSQVRRVRDMVRLLTPEQRIGLLTFRHPVADVEVQVRALVDACAIFGDDPITVDDPQWQAAVQVIRSVGIIDDVEAQRLSQGLPVWLVLPEPGLPDAD